MRLPKIHDVAFSSKFIHIENADDVPAIAKELYKAFGFVQPKVSDVEFKRLIELVEALTAPMYFPLYLKMVKSIIDDYERVLSFDINQLYRFSLTCDLKLLRLFYRGLELSLPDAMVELFTHSSANPLEGKFKNYRAAGCFGERRGGVQSLMSVQVELTEDYKNKVLDCGYFIEFCLFQFQLTTGIRLTEKCGDKARQFKGSPCFYGGMNRHLKDLSGAALLDKFAYLFGQSCSGYGGVEDSGFREKCYELLECFFHPQYPQPCFDEAALRRQMLAHPLLWNMPDATKRSYAAQSNVTGNRLSLDEKLHLPLRSNVMLPHEIAVAIDYFKALSIDGVRLFLMFLTAKPIGYLSKLVISTVALKLDMGDYIDVSRGVWVRRPVHTPKAFEPTPEQQAFMYEHRGFVELPLPKVLVTLLQKQMKKLKLEVAKLDELIPNFNVAQTLYFDNDQRTITEAAMRSGLFTYLAKQTDANYAALVLANSEYVQFTHLYYLSRSHNDVMGAYTSALVSIGFDVTEQHPNECYTGSKMAVRVERLAEGTSALGASVKELMRQSENRDVEALIKAHNAFALYTVFMLACATTHRPRKAFNFSNFTCGDGLCLLSDKVNFDDSKIRINPLPVLAAKQVEAYRNHCRLIAKQLPDELADIRTLLFAVSRNHALGVAEFGVINRKYKHKYRWHGIGKAQLETFVQPFVPLPLNVFRHHLASQLRDTALREKDSGSYAQQLLGHISNGEHPLAVFSPCKMVDVIKLVEPIEGILQASGFELIECQKPRGTIPKLTMPYTPYTGNLEVPTREKYQWLMQWAASFVQTYYIKPKPSERPTKQAVIEQAVAKFESKQERQKVTKFVNRFVNRHQSLKTQATWNDIKFNELELGVDAIHLQKQADKIRLLAHHEIKSEIKSEIKNNGDLPFKLVLSLM